MIWESKKVLKFSLKYFFRTRISETSCSFTSASSSRILAKKKGLFCFSLINIPRANCSNGGNYIQLAWIREVRKFNIFSLVSFCGGAAILSAGIFYKVHFTIS